MLECLEMQIDAMSSVNALNVAIFPVTCWFWFWFHFSARYLLYTVSSGRLASVGRP